MYFGNCVLAPPPFRVDCPPGKLWFRPYLKHEAHNLRYFGTNQWRIQDFPDGGRGVPIRKSWQKLLLPSATTVAERLCFHKRLSFLFTGGGSGRSPPRGRHPPPPLDRHPPPGQTPTPWQTPTPTPWTDTHPLGRHPPPGQTSPGRYASYWNAFLLDKIFAKNCMKMKEIGLGGGRGAASLEPAHLDPPMWTVFLDEQWSAPSSYLS